MKKTKILFATISLFTVFILSFTVLNAQNKTQTKFKGEANTIGLSQTNYEVYLRAVVGTNNSSSKKKASKILSKLIEEIDDDFSYKNYELLFGSYQQVANLGLVQSSNVLDGIGGLKVAGYPVSISWSLEGISHRASYKNYVKLASFRFSSQDVPIKVNSKVAYRPITYTIKQLKVNLDKPTIIGSLSVPLTDETLFFIVTVKKY